MVDQQEEGPKVSFLLNFFFFEGQSRLNLHHHFFCVFSFSCFFSSPSYLSSLKYSFLWVLLMKKFYEVPWQALSLQSRRFSQMILFQFSSLKSHPFLSDLCL